MKKKVIYKTIIVIYAIIGMLSIAKPQLLPYTEIIAVTALCVVVRVAFAFINLIFDNEKKDEQDESDN